MDSDDIGGWAEEEPARRVAWSIGIDNEEYLAVDGCHVLEESGELIGSVVEDADGGAGATEGRGFGFECGVKRASVRIGDEPEVTAFARNEGVEQGTQPRGSGVV
jgi:hypothetical protein